jgi:hypothetical protein
MTADEGTKLSGIAAGAEVNVIASITLNGTTVSPDANRVVALTVITKAVNDLENYYTKSTTYTKTEVDNLISALATVNLAVVQTLPTTNISTSTIYLVPKATAQTQNVYDEYICIDATTTPATWERIGDTEIDLSNYIQKSSTAGLVKNDSTIATNSYATTSQIPSVTGKADKVTGATNGNFAGLDANGNLTDSGKSASSFVADVHFDQTVNLSTSASVTATFTDAAITANSLIDVACSEWGLVPDDVTVSAGTCVVTLPKVDTAHSVTLRIYVR